MTLSLWKGLLLLVRKPGVLSARVTKSKSTSKLVGNMMMLAKHTALLLPVQQPLAEIHVLAFVRGVAQQRPDVDFKDPSQCGGLSALVSDDDLEQAGQVVDVLPAIQNVSGHDHLSSLDQFCQSWNWFRAFKVDKPLIARFDQGGQVVADGFQQVALATAVYVDAFQLLSVKLLGQARKEVVVSLNSRSNVGQGSYEASHPEDLVLSRVQVGDDSGPVAEVQGPAPLSEEEGVLEPTDPCCHFGDEKIL